MLRSRMGTLGALLAAALSGLLASLSLPVGAGVTWPALIWIAFAPWLMVSSRLRPALAALVGFLAGLAFHIPGIWPIFAAAIPADSVAPLPDETATFAFFVFYAMPYAVFGWLDARWLGARNLRAGLRPVVRAGVLASLISVLWAPFPYTVAVGLTAFPSMLQLAEFGGEPLLLWLLFLPSAALAELLASSGQRRVFALAPAVGVLVLAFCFGHLRGAALDARENDPATPRIDIVAMQLDLPRFASATNLLLDRSGRATSAVELTRRSLDEAPACDLALWPELPLEPPASAAVCRRGADLATRLGVPVVMQCYAEEGEQQFLTAALFDPATPTPRIHAKSSLVPLYETPLFGNGRLVPGEAGTVFDFGRGVGLIPAICYELHSRRHLRRAALAGGNVVLQMASFTPFQRLPIDILDISMARIRAVEFRTPIVRSANRGAAGWIDGFGRVRDLSEPFGRSARCLSIPVPEQRPTVFARIQPAAPWLPGGLALLVFIGGRTRRSETCASGSY